MGATMLEELLPRRSAWITGNHWLASFFNVWRHLLGLGCSLRTVVPLLAVLLRATVVASLVANASPLGRALDIVLLICSIPARFGSYEGDELVYLCRMKSGLGLTHTSSTRFDEGKKACLCKEDFYLKDNQCKAKKCGDGIEPNTKKCSCPPG